MGFDMNDLKSASVLHAMILDRFPNRDADGVRDAILNIITRAPRAERRAKGQWSIAIGYDQRRTVMCSECQKMNFEPTDYCPNCGADMRGESK